MLGLAALDMEPVDRVAVADGRLRISSHQGRAYPDARGVAVPLTVVLAEDSPLMRDGLVGVLTRFGHQVCAAGDADG